MENASSNASMLIHLFMLFPFLMSLPQSGCAVAAALPDIPGYGSWLNIILGFALFPDSTGCILYRLGRYTGCCLVPVYNFRL